MDQIFERHLLTCLEDEDRLRSMIDQMIEDKEVPPFDAYTKETKAKRNKRHKKVKPIQLIKSVLSFILNS
jgi:hypothetical protein